MNKEIQEKVLQMVIESPLSAYELAKQTGISAVTLSHYRRGLAKPNASTTAMLAKYFHIDSPAEIHVTVPSSAPNQSDEIAFLRKLVSAQQETISRLTIELSNLIMSAANNENNKV